MKVSEKYKNLYKKALETAPNAYAPYSNFHVGAALLFSDGSIITGVNIENRSFGATNCAERTAFFRAIASGKTDFVALAVATPDSDYPVSPCGICRQVISEFTKPDFPIVFGNSIESVVELTISDLYSYDALHELKK